MVGGCDEIKRKGLEIIGGVRNRIQSKIEVDFDDHSRSKSSHLIVPIDLFFHQEFDNVGEE